MALVTSDQNMTVIILNNTEAEALGDILNRHPSGFGQPDPVEDLQALNEDYSILNELTNAMLDEKMAFAYEDDEETTDIDRKRP